MKNTLTITLLVLFLFGCSGSDMDTQSDRFQEEKDNTAIVETEERVVLNNPAIMLGSDLGSIIRKAYQIGNYELMFQFTANETIQKVGRDKLMNCYKNLDMGKEIKLKSITEEGDVHIMNYESINQATKVMVRLPVIIENDTAKIIPSNPCGGSLYE